MNNLSEENFDLLLERARLQLTPEEKHGLKAVWQAFVQPLNELHNWDLQGEEVSGGFLPHDRLAEGTK